ncbi:hypothetical protein YTPLAS18_05670 [Nitrospira sp.]|nr:hypothetical protein YTPLAS18_05670 [Nitrospira sp.]
MRDVVDQVAKSILEAQQDLERALDDLDKLPALDPHSVGFAAHALQNYLFIVGATTELLAKAVADHPDPNVQIWLGYAKRANEMMAGCVADLMNTATIAREPGLKPNNVNLTVLLRRFVDQYAGKSALKNLRLKYEPPQEAIIVWTDGVAFAAVLDNIFSNAIKYSSPGKEIRIMLRTELGSVVCGVEDQGPGLSPEDQAKLFQRGVTLSSVPTGGEPQSGYGLAVAKELMDQLGGSIWCESALGEGARFLIRLPYHQEAAVVVPTTPVESKQ